MEAVINWMVESIAYTLENYHVEFGLRSNALNMRNEAVNGSSDVTSTNLLYSTTLSGLNPFTQYYYRVVATNTFTMTQSEVQMFQTSETGITNSD